MIAPCACGCYPYLDEWKNLRENCVEHFVRCECGTIGQVAENPEKALKAWNDAAFAKAGLIGQASQQTTAQQTTCSDAQAAEPTQEPSAPEKT